MVANKDIYCQTINPSQIIISGTGNPSIDFHTKQFCQTKIPRPREEESGYAPLSKMLTCHNHYKATITIPLKCVDIYVMSSTRYVIHGFRYKHRIKMIS